jgi:hypothetical protein
MSEPDPHSQVTTALALYASRLEKLVKAYYREHQAKGCGNHCDLVAGVAPDKCATGTAATVSDRSAQWQLALDFTARSENLRSSCHAVERIPSAGRGRATQFVPIRFAFSNKLTRHDKLLLAFDALVISEMFGGEVTLAGLSTGTTTSRKR